MMVKLMAVVEKLQQELFDVEKSRKEAEACVSLGRSYTARHHHPLSVSDPHLNPEHDTNAASMRGLPRCPDVDFDREPDATPWAWWST
jgi:hypothetical protein